MEDITFVTALYDLKREELDGGFGRSMDQYLKTFKKLLKQDINLVVYCEQEVADFVWEHRDKKNTKVIVQPINFPLKSSVDKIRVKEEWYKQAGWLEQSPQAKLEWYNPLVMSKQFKLNDTSINNFFGTKYFFWIDAGISNTVNVDHYFNTEDFEYKLKQDVKTNKMLYVAFPYDGQNEVHGFKKEAMNRFAGEDTTYVCRGGFFGGTREAINRVNDVYYKTLDDTLNNGYMGTEESVFTIITYKLPHYFNVQMINANGLIGTYFDRVTKRTRKEDDDFALYFLTFNAPEQIRDTLKKFKKNHPEVFESASKYLINNTTDKQYDEAYKNLVEEFDLDEKKFDNIGITGGRIFAAEHFNESNHEYMVFFEDDMQLNGLDQEGKICSAGFKKWDDDLFDKAVMILEENELDYLKLTFSEFFGDAHKNWSWENMSPKDRKEYLANDECIDSKSRAYYTGAVRNLGYAVGEYYYSNWPILFSKKGNKKLFIDSIEVKTPAEAHVMATSQKLMRTKKLKAGTLLASPITHRRSKGYKTKRVENRYKK